jgi:hypothetical protein
VKKEDRYYPGDLITSAWGTQVFVSCEFHKREGNHETYDEVILRAKKGVQAFEGITYDKIQFTLRYSWEQNK